MTTHFKRHTFSSPAQNGEPYDVHAYGDTINDARAALYNGGDGYLYRFTEEIPYTHAGDVNAIAALLPGEWEAAPVSKEYADCGWHITRTSDGLALSISFETHPKSRMVLYACTAKQRTGRRLREAVYGGPDHKRIECPSIGCSQDKPATAIARDIERRLLPDAEIYYAASAAMVAKNNAFVDGKDTTVAAIAARLSPHGWRGDNFAGRHGDMVVHSSTSVTVTLRSVDPSIVLALLDNPIFAALFVR